MNIYEQSIEKHNEWKGKTEILSRVKIENNLDLALAYTPGVAEPCLRINKNPELVNKYTRRWNTVAVVTDGTAVLGLGDIGPKAALPVMEGKAVLFKRFGDIDAVPICLDTKDAEEIIRTVKNIAPSFGGINLEDISSPRCFEIEKRLKEELDIPVFHDDQHGTAIVVLAGLINGLKICGKKKENVRIVINGAGAAAIATARLLIEAGFVNIILCDTKGIIFKGREGNNPVKEEIANITNAEMIGGLLADGLKNADVFIGLSSGGALTKEMILKMNEGPIIFALANPVPEIEPEEAILAGARIVATGRSDFRNQVNNALVFPGIFRGALDSRATQINYQMKIAAAEAIAGLVGERERNEGLIIPSLFNGDVAKKVAEGVRKKAEETGIANIRAN